MLYYDNKEEHGKIIDWKMIFKEYRKLWMNTYPHANWRYMINPYMKVERRFKCLLAILGLYPFKKDRI